MDQIVLHQPPMGGAEIFIFIFNDKYILLGKK